MVLLVTSTGTLTLCTYYYTRLENMISEEFYCILYYATYFVLYSYSRGFKIRIIRFFKIILVISILFDSALSRYLNLPVFAMLIKQKAKLLIFCNALKIQ